MLEPGTRLGRYAIRSLIGVGGMGEVYLADDTSLGRPVAIKTLPQDIAADPDRAMRFEREARLLASLSHPHIAAVVGFEEAPVPGQSLRYLVLEHIDRPRLDERLAAGPLSMREALTIALQIALALEAAHDAGVVHRDLKPANVKFKADHTVKVLDFGLAKATARETAPPENSPTLISGATQAGMLLGTAAYMSPEQARARAVDQRTDLWSFGCVLYELLTRRQAFGGDTVSDSIAHVLHREIDWSLLPPETPSSIRRLLRRCLERDVRQRQQSAADARLEIEDALRGQPEGLASVDTTRSPGPLRPSVLPWVVAGTAGAAAMIAFVWGLVGGQGAVPLAREAVHFTISTPAGTTLKRNHPSFAVAPDGRSIAVVAGDPNNLNATSRLELRRLDELEFKRIPNTEFASSPFFLNDGKRVGFLQERTFQLTVVDVSTGVTSVVSRLDSADVFGVSEAPGNSIVFAHAAPRENPALKRVPVTGGVPAVIAQPDPARGEREFLWPQVMSGRNEILFTAGYRDGHYALEALSLGTGARHVVLDNALMGHLSLHGYVVYFRPTQRTAASTAGDLVAQPVTLPSLVAQGSPVSLLTNVQHALFTGGRGVDAGLRADTLLVLRSSDTSLPKSLAWIDRAGAVTSMAAAPRLYRQPDLSPDGGRVAFLLDEAARDIWVYDVARDIASPVTRSRAQEETPRWSPDGRSIAYMGDYEGKESVLLAAADGSQAVQRLWTFEGHAHLDGWRADGQLLYVDVREGANQGIWVYSFPKKTAAVFLQTSANEFGAEPSPDGRWVAYVSDESGKEQVYLRRPDGTGRVQASRDGGVEPVWSHDSRELFFRQLDRSALLAVSVGPGAEAGLGPPTILFTVPFASGGRDRAYDVSPDGRRFLVVRSADATAQDIEITVNFSERLKQLASR